MEHSFRMSKSTSTFHLLPKKHVTCKKMEEGANQQTHQTAGSEGRHFIGMDHSTNDHLMSICVHTSSLSCN